MPAHNINYPWMSYYENYDYFEQRMSEHNRVSGIDKINPSLYHIELVNGNVIKTFICECYSFDVAEYFEATQELGELNAVVINSIWCGYSLEVKHLCRNRQVGIYKIREFMAALNMERYWQYLTDYEKEQFKEKGWL